MTDLTGRISDALALWMSENAEDYPYLLSRVAGQSHWPSLQTKPPNMMGLLPSFGAK
jgi:hypothetical protein